MVKKNVILFFLLIYVIILSLQFTVIHNALNYKSAEPIKIQAQALGKISFCSNYPPIINISMCNTTLYEHINFYCQVNATDIDSSSFSFDATFISSFELFNISVDGIINYTPNSNDTGTHSVLITVYDDSGCVNGDDTDTFVFDVINTNDPPYLLELIPDFNMSQGTQKTPFDLDDYFADPDGDNLTYNYSDMGNFDIVITENNEVIFIPASSFYGEEDIYFVAYDPLGEFNISNNVTVLVIQTPVQTTTTIIDATSSSSGGGGGGSSGVVPSCIPQWYCKPWGNCEPDGFKRRECYDLKFCENELNKPNMTEVCEFISTCSDGFLGPDEESIDCGGVCPECGTCYDNICNNNEECTTNSTNIPDCGGPCQACDYTKETCYDFICNNDEDCTKGITNIPDCGGPCVVCQFEDEPLPINSSNFGLFMLVAISVLLISYTAKKSYPYLLLFLKKKRKEKYEQKLMLETKITQSILESLKEILKLIETEDLQKLIIMFSSLVRKYFKHLFELNFEFTYQELIKEINTRNLSETFKKILLRFFDRSLVLEFSGNQIQKTEFRALIGEFKLILFLTAKEPLNIDDPELKPKNHTKLDRLYHEIAQAESYLRNNQIDEASTLYKKLHSGFDKLDHDHKQKIHSFVERLYHEINLKRHEMDN